MRSSSYDSQLARTACIMCSWFYSMFFLLSVVDELDSWTGDIADTPISFLCRIQRIGSDLKYRYTDDITIVSDQASFCCCF
ncbi:hypothetical protein BDV12DRAFT_158972 [Aspergillus spectabilis]